MMTGLVPEPVPKEMWPSVPPPFDFTGRRLGKYEVLSRLSAGGQGTVYLGYDDLLQRDVAIKVSHPSLSGDEPHGSRVLQEGTALARLDHPHLPRIYDSGVEDGVAYLVMEFVPGVPLHRRVRTSPPDRRQIFQFMEEISAAVAAAHQIGLLHLDLKPENVIVMPDGHCKLVDFGLSWWRKTQLESRLPFVAGTCGYLAPEQLRGDTQQWTEATDVFGMGGILYFLLKSTPPLSVSQLNPDLVKEELEERCQDLHATRCGPTLKQICRRSLAFDPAHRYVTAREFRKALHRGKRIRETICAAACLTAGVWLILLGLLGHEDMGRGRQNQVEEQRVLTDEKQPQQLHAVEIALELIRSQPITPQLAFWAPSMGLVEFRGLKHDEVDGKQRWRPRGRNGTLSATFQGDFICLIVFRDRTDIRQLVENSPLFVPVPQPDPTGTGTVTFPGRTTQIIEFSSESPLADSLAMLRSARSGIDPETERLLQALQDELSQTGSRFACAVAIPSSDSDVAWDWNMTFQLSKD